MIGNRGGKYNTFIGLYIRQGGEFSTESTAVLIFLPKPRLLLDYHTDLKPISASRIFDPLQNKPEPTR